jgi:hypothetical protein
MKCWEGAVNDLMRMEEVREVGFLFGGFGNCTNDLTLSFSIRQELLIRSLWVICTAFSPSIQVTRRLLVCTRESNGIFYPVQMFLFYPWSSRALQWAVEDVPPAVSSHV